MSFIAVSLSGPVTGCLGHRVVVLVTDPALVVGIVSCDDAESVAFGVELLQVRQFCVAEVFGGCDGDGHGFVVGS